MGCKNGKLEICIRSDYKDDWDVVEVHDCRHLAEPPVCMCHELDGSDSLLFLSLFCYPCQRRLLFLSLSCPVEHSQNTPTPTPDCTPFRSSFYTHLHFLMLMYCNTYESSNEYNQSNKITRPLPAFLLHLTQRSQNVFPSRCFHRKKKYPK